jgi:hypothetical protein
MAWPRLSPYAIDDLPQNATELITDWQALLRPMSSLRALASQMLGRSTLLSGHQVEWFMTDRHVDVSSVDRNLLLEAAHDPELVELFEHCKGSLVDERFPSNDPMHTIALNRMVQPLDSETVLIDRAVSIVLGIAANDAITAGLGYRSREVAMACARRLLEAQDEGGTGGGTARTDHPTP